MAKEQKKCTKKVKESGSSGVHDRIENKSDIFNKKGLECVPEEKLPVKKIEVPILNKSDPPKKAVVVDDAHNFLHKIKVGCICSV